LAQCVRLIVTLRPDVVPARGVPVKRACFRGVHIIALAAIPVGPGDGSAIRPGPTDSLVELQPKEALPALPPVAHRIGTVVVFRSFWHGHLKALTFTPARGGVVDNTHVRADDVLWGGGRSDRHRAGWG